MKTVFSNKELAHVFAQQNQQSGRGSNMFFEGTKIYSYGYHFCIANFIKPSIVLFNSNSYSNSTNKHQSYVLRALHSVKVFSVPFTDSKYDFVNDWKELHTKNAEYYRTQVFSCLEKATKANTNSEWLLHQAEMYNGQGLDYCQEFKLGKKLTKWFEGPIQVSDKLQAKIDKQSERARIAREEKEKAERVKNSEIYHIVLPLWFDHKKPHPAICNHSVSDLREAYLRMHVDGKHVETSHGARVSLQAAKVLFDRILSGKDVKGFEIDGYTVISLNGVLTIGCHKIERSEINRFAALQGWGQIEIH